MSASIKEKPILMSSPMVRALLDARKTQTRRVVKSRGIWSVEHRGGGFERWPGAESDAGEWEWFRSPYGDVGDRLWVRETWVPSEEPENHRDAKDGFTYRADWSMSDEQDYRDFNWRPSIFMPRTASRITLEVIGVRVERVQQITGVDANCEGLESRDAFELLWRVINGKRPGCSWDDNPWVWVIEFRRVEDQAHGGATHGSNALA